MRDEDKKQFFAEHFEATEGKELIRKATGEVIKFKAQTHGYGMVSLLGKMYYYHKVWELLTGGVFFQDNAPIKSSKKVQVCWRCNTTKHDRGRGLLECRCMHEGFIVCVRCGVSFTDVKKMRRKHCEHCYELVKEEKWNSKIREINRRRYNFGKSKGCRELTAEEQEFLSLEDKNLERLISRQRYIDARPEKFLSVPIDEFRHFGWSPMGDYSVKENLETGEVEIIAHD